MPADLFRFQDFELDQIAYELRRGGQSVRLERIPFELLGLLVERSGQLVTRQEIIDRLWGQGVFHDTEHGINTAIRKIRLALQDDSDFPRFILTIPAKGYRFVAPVERIIPAGPAPVVREMPRSSPAATEQLKTPQSARLGILLPAFVLLCLLAVVPFLRFHHAEALSASDTIVLADFTNSTGDPIFDDALKEATSVELAQSPFLNLVSAEQVQQTLRMMKHPIDAKITPELAFQVCQRTNGAAVLESSIAQIGSQYDLILKAVSCSTGASLASAEARANDKNHILGALEAASTAIRERLGESLVTVQKFDRPLAQATTGSLDALKAFSLGVAKYEKGDQAAAIPLFRQAISLDSDFAMAYAYLGRSYQVLGVGNSSRTNQALQKAFDLRDRASEREKFDIAAAFYQFVTLQTDQTIQNCELWEQSYPRDFVPHRILGFENGALANYGHSAEEFRKAMQIDPKQALPYAGLMIDLMAAHRFDDAEAVYKDAQAHNVEAGEVQRIRYRLAFLESDAAGMARLAESLFEHPGYQVRSLAEQSNTAAYFGRLKEARELSARSVAKALTEKDFDTAAGIESDSSMREAFFGNFEAAQAHAAAASKLGGPPDVYAMAVALADDPAHATKVVDLVASRTPSGSFIDRETMGEFRGAIELKRGNAARALELLASASSWEAGWFEVYRPAYLRGQAYLLAHRGQEAATEFQKIIDHPGIVVNLPYAALARLGLARAYRLQGDLPKARIAYQDFLALWKDADPDIRVLKQAKSEFSRLQ